MLAIFCLIFFAFLNVYFAFVWQVALLKWFKFLEIGLLVFYFSVNYKQKNKLVVLPLAVSIIYTGLISLGQFLLQRTIGGPFYFLGERTFSSSTPGIALFNLFERSYLRPYATFPHPNALAGYSLVVVALLFKEKGKSLLYFFSVLMAFVIIVLSFSQNVWLVALLVFLLVKFKNRLNISFSCSPLVVLLIVGSLILPIVSKGVILANYSFPENVQDRLELVVAAGIAFVKSPLIGVGAGNFIALLPQIQKANWAFFQPRVIWQLQPVHNIYLLILSEMGIIGFLLFFYIIFRALKKAEARNHQHLIFAFLVILLSGVVDHYWFTLQQTQLLFALVLGALFSLKGDTIRE